MLARDVEMFIEHCENKGLATKTIGSYEQTLRLLMLWLDEQGIVQTEKITHVVIQDYVKQIKERGKYTVTSNPNSGNYQERRIDFGKKVSDVTINNYLRNMSAFFNWCVEEGLILRSPVKRRDYMRVKDCVNTARTQVTGRQYVDGCLRKGTTFSRIQTSKDFENFAFYATYKKADSDKYMGLFGKNLMTRANYDAKQAEKQANASGSEADLVKATTLRDKANSMKVYQLKLETVKKLKVPSDENASDITARLLKEKEFKQNLEASIADSKEKMRRPTQQVLFKQAENALKKDPATLTASEKVAIYKALNLSLTNHNAQEVAAQSRFYAELSKKGYNALLDYNDKDYSSYHAKRPMIVFDTDSVRLQSVTETNPKVVDKLYMRYNAERIAKEVGANTIGYVSKLGNKTVSECSAYMERKMNDYLS